MADAYSVRRPEVLTVTEAGGKTYRGANQEWYPTEWQQRAGCGPTTAAMLLAYLAATRPELRELYPSGRMDKESFTAFMEEVWQFVTPGRRGLNSNHLFVSGVTDFARERGIDLPVRELDIPRLRIARPSYDQCAAFLRTGLNADCPVAFLNFSRGRVANLDSWHWVPILSLEERSNGQALCVILDGGRERIIDFRLWYQTSRGGGGLVYLPAELHV